MVALNGDPEVMRYIGTGAAQTPSQVGFWLECMLADARHGFANPEAPAGLPGWLVAIKRDTQAFIGMGILAMFPAAHATAVGAAYCPTPCIEVGYRFAQPFWGRGFASETADALVRYGYETMGLSRIVAIADVRNHASNRVLEKAGLKIETTYSFSGVDIHFRGGSRG